MDFSVIAPYYPLFIKGTWYTIVFSFLALAIGMVIGLIACLMKLSKSKPLNIISSIYVEVIRDTPLMVQLMLFYFGLPQVGINFPSIFGMPESFTAGAFALSLNSGAYIAELMRSGIQAVNKGQMEASRSLGLNYWQSMQLVIIPQAIKNILPALANEFIALIKESSIVYVIGIKDLMAMANTVKNATYQPLAAYVVAAAIYFVITFTLSKVIQGIEKKMSV